jgi:hypothetical protein
MPAQYRVPAFPLTANVYRSAVQLTFPLTGVQPTLTTRCQLRTRQLPFSAGAIALTPVLLLATPSGTDIRQAAAGNPNADVIEVPINTGRYYAVLAVDDVAKGFGNEYRLVAMTQVLTVINGWPFPTP